MPSPRASWGRSSGPSSTPTRVSCPSIGLGCFSWPTVEVVMPAKSQAQRALLNAKFGHKWVQRHHFDNAGKLPRHVKGSKAMKKGKHAGHSDMHTGSTNHADMVNDLDGTGKPDPHADPHHHKMNKEHGMDAGCNAKGHCE